MKFYERKITDQIIRFFKETFNLYYDVEDFYDKRFYPFFKAEYISVDCLSISFPIKSSIKTAELRVCIRQLKNNGNKEFFQKIVFDYNVQFENEVLEINNLSVESVFENKYLLLWKAMLWFVILVIFRSKSLLLIISFY